MFYLPHLYSIRIGTWGNKYVHFGEQCGAVTYIVALCEKNDKKDCQTRYLRNNAGRAALLGIVYEK